MQLMFDKTFISSLYDYRFLTVFFTLFVDDFLRLNEPVVNVSFVHLTVLLYLSFFPLGFYTFSYGF